MSFTNLSILDVSYDDKAYGNLIDPYEWNQNFLKIEQIFNQNKQIIEENFNSVSSSNTPSEAIEELGQTLPSTVREQLLLIVNLLSTKASSDEVNSSISGLLKSAVLDENTGIVTFTKYDGSTFTIDFATEKIPAKFELVNSGENVYLKITNIDGSYTQTDVTSLLNIYLFNNSSNIEFTVDRYNVTAKIKSGSIVKSDFSSDLISYFDDNVAAAAANALSSETSKLAAESAKNESISARDSALNSENNAKTYRDSSEQNYLLSKSYAVGGSGIRANEATDNAEYYMNQAKSYKDSSISAKDVAVAASENAKSSESKTEEYKNSTSLMKGEVASMLSETQTAKDGAVAAKTAAEAARNESVSARDESVSAKEYSVAAKEAAETAKNESISAKEDAVAAKTAAETARDQAQEIAGGDFATRAELTEGLSTKLSASDIINNLTSGGVSVPLSAEQGKVLKGLIDKLNGNSSEVGSIAYQIAQIVAGADTRYDTLKEIADWIISDTTGASKMASDILALQNEMSNHTHDDRYYTESEIDSKISDINTSLSGKAPSNHTHDDRYYTESEIDNKVSNINAAIGNKANKPTISTSTMSASGWSDGVYSFESIYPVATYDIEIEINGDNCTSEQLKAWSSAQIVGSSTTNSCKAMGDIPTIDIPITIKVVVK